MENEIYDIIIIGGGAAGLTAALYSARAGKSVLLLENTSFGGQISYSPEVENYPGFKSISGLDFSDRLLSQAVAAGAKTAFETALSVKCGEKFKTVTTDSGEHKCRAVIIAAGLKHRKIGLENEDRFTGKGISYCAVCDGSFFKNKRVAVYGGGNTAIEEALFLSDICESVTLIHRRNELRADNAEIKKLESKENIIYKLDCTVVSLNGESSLTSVTVKNSKTQKTEELKISALFTAIGQIPQNEAFKNIVKLDEYGFIESGEDCKTQTDGIFAAGDCRTKELRQLTTAVSDGAVAATAACKYTDLKNI
ncbi:MAG: thioredoxin-disulfide reductase [Acutalibacteraceae bacterium]|nr:thioredoxin-disulfide reductase [Acutalibacteraceae bacterium]